MANATRISEKGEYLFMFCEKHQSDQLHHILVIEYKMFEVDLQHICFACMNTHFDRQEIAKEHPTLGIEESMMFYDLKTLDNEDWNDFVKFSGLERL